MNSFLKTYLLIASMSLVAINTSLAQDNVPCSFDEYTNNNSTLQVEHKIQAKINQLRNLPASKNLLDSIKTIPVVIHVIHTGGPENISDAQIQSQMTVLNEDFGKLPGTNGDGLGVNTKIRFCLAKIDPNGNCTNGIVRIHSPLTNHDRLERLLLKELSFWDNTKYLNIYVVNSIAGSSLGYSSFPGGPPDEDGIVIENNVFGKIGTAAARLGRVGTHEVGHWLGMYHTFQGGCGTDLCLEGDFVCDTPPQALPNFGCPTTNTCSNDVPNVNDQKENYMDFTSDACKNTFTDGQKLRMHSSLDTIRTAIWTQANLIATGCDTNYIPPVICGLSANFVTLTPTVCVGNSVSFIDISLNDATSWQWSFPGGTPASSTLENPTIIYNSLGNYDVQLIASNANSTDTLLLSNYIDVTTPGVGDPIPYSENFDSGIFPPGDLSINNLDGGITWGLDSAASVSPNYSIKINNFINTNFGSADEIVLPYLDFTPFSGTGTIVFMTFKWAYARSDPSFSDEMIVLLSTDCGVNFDQIYYRTGNALVTGPTQTTPFIPNDTEWKSATIPLNQYLTEQYVQVKIVNVTDGGNNLYIDNINIGELPTNVETIEKEKEVNIYPNPASNNVFLVFSDNVDEVTINIYNTVGKLVLSQTTNQQKNVSISVEHLPEGIYYLESKRGELISRSKLIVAH